MMEELPVCALVGGEGRILLREAAVVKFLILLYLKKINK